MVTQRGAERGWRHQAGVPGLLGGVEVQVHGLLGKDGFRVAADVTLLHIHRPLADDFTACGLLHDGAVLMGPGRRFPPT